MTDTITITVQVGGGAAQSFDLAQTATEAAPPPTVAGDGVTLSAGSDAPPPPSFATGTASDIDDGPAAPPGMGGDADADDADSGDVPPPDA